MRLRRDLTGSLLGILVFLGGIALLLLTFKMAYEMFTTPPADTLRLQPGKPIDLGSAGTNFVGSLIRIVLLVTMALVGSLIANRGIQLYADSRGHVHLTHKDELSDEQSRFTAEGGREAR